ncbi:hypothetical protein [Fulvivirga ligni]|uniref:hypothetical protein n=1 Tax=Fulvivirga ligni TaxID=2904246 RepID=UPI001F326CAA|nr:hypothetical protein [Fulvivirga ligni]UII22813.1 hypothetical protein LVD16_06190 [Fulvivirga ligni]
MHEIEPYQRWLHLYNPAEDELSPWFGKEYNYDLYSENIYGYYIDPAWDYIGSETLYIKVLYADYDEGYAIMEFIGEWNDTINNDIMHLKRNIIETYSHQGINKYILIGENIFNFHGSDDCYYEEWFDDVEDGWIAAINFPDFVREEFKNFNVDSYINMGGSLQIDKWRTMAPYRFYSLVEQLIQRRISLI